ncbi:MAG: peptidase T [Prevotella sp.]|nr:peptidase T [Candidatus Equicola faecalis]
MNLTERFLRYTTFNTQSSEDSNTMPSTEGQLKFADYLKNELLEEGFPDVVMDAKGYIYATLPSNTVDDVPTIGFIAHYDTSPDCSGKDVKAHIVENYDGSDIVLSDDIVTDIATYPELLAHKGEDLIVTDGHTLLGADDKAGIAEIVQAMVWLKEHPDVKHGTVRIAFNPDEEIGIGAHHFDVDKFACQWAYTIDGGDLGEFEYENFNAASAKILISGKSVHPGYAKGKMKNATLIATELVSLLPRAETPEFTEGYEGFYHLVSLSGNVEKASLSLIIRDHDNDRFSFRKAFVQRCVEMINARYGEGTAQMNLSDTYYNMRMIMEDNRHVTDIALRAMEECGVSPKVQPIRGGTDGAQLSFRSLPCPNIFAGGVNFHGPHEFVSVQTMQKAMEVIVKICTLTASIK